MIISLQAYNWFVKYFKIIIDTWKNTVDISISRINISASKIFNLSLRLQTS